MIMRTKWILIILNALIDIINDSLDDLKKDYDNDHSDESRDEYFRQINILNSLCRVYSAYSQEDKEKK